MGLCRCYHNCCGNDKANEVYTPRRERWCTDVLCLVLLILAWGGMGTLGYMCAAVKPQLLWKLYYPTDSYGQFCGRSGSATEHDKGRAAAPGDTRPSRQPARPHRQPPAVRAAAS